MSVMNRHMRMVAGNEGFTLVELLVVIVIIGILSAIAVPMYMGQRTKAMMTEAETNLQICYTLQEQFYAENGRYAPWLTRTNFLEQGQWGTYKIGTTHLKERLPGWSPLPPEELLFDYYVVSRSNGQDYECMADGRAGTAVSSTALKLSKSGQILTWAGY